MSCDALSIPQAEEVTGLPAALIKALAECGEIPAEVHDGQLYVGKAALFGWCRLFAKILSLVIRRQPRCEIGGGISARSLVWMADAGLLTGRDRVRL